MSGNYTVKTANTSPRGQWGEDHLVKAYRTVSVIRTNAFHAPHAKFKARLFMCVSYADQLACMNLTEVNSLWKTERSREILQAILQTDAPFVNMVWLKLDYG